MAFTYTDSAKIILEAWGKFQVTLLEAVIPGDLLSLYNTDASYTVQFADQSDRQRADCIAMEAGAAGDTIWACLKAVLRTKDTVGTGGAVTAVYFAASTDFFGAPLYLGEDGKPSSSVGSSLGQAIGMLIARNQVLIDLSPVSGMGMVLTKPFTKGIVMGTTGGSGSPIALGTLTTSWYGIEICVTASLGSYECHAVRAEVRTSAASASGNINCGRFDTIIYHNIKSAEGVNTTVQFLGASTMSGRVAVVAASLYSASGVVLTKSVNDISGIFIQHWLQNDPGTMTTGYFNSGLQISIIGASYCEYGIALNIKTSRLTAAILISPDDSANIPRGISFADLGGGSGGNVTAALWFATNCPATYFAQWQTKVGCCVANTSNLGSDTCIAVLTVRIAGVSGYIPVLAAVPSG